MNAQWLLERAQAPIAYSLTRDAVYKDALLKNEQVRYWLDLLTDRVRCGDLGNIHGSHDYRYENIVGKCFILGLDNNIAQFDEQIYFFLRYLQTHIENTYDQTLTFGKMYGYRDYETVLACWLGHFGYGQEACVQYIARKRIDILYEFTKQERYDLYIPGAQYPGVKKEWRPYIVDPALYADGNIAVPEIHDYILIAGVYASLDQRMKDKADHIAMWLFGEGYKSIHYSYYYYAPKDPSYKAKSINYKPIIMDFSLLIPDKEEVQSLLLTCFMLSHFKGISDAKWFKDARVYLDRYRDDAGCYLFPRGMIAEKRDAYAVKGGHMNAGEDKRDRQYARILSTYWMERILSL